MSDRHLTDENSNINDGTNNNNIPLREIKEVPGGISAYTNQSELSNAGSQPSDFSEAKKNSRKDVQSGISENVKDGQKSDSEKQKSLKDMPTAVTGPTGNAQHGPQNNHLPVIAEEDERREGQGTNPEYKPKQTWVLELEDEMEKQEEEIFKLQINHGLADEDEVFQIAMKDMKFKTNRDKCDPVTTTCGMIMCRTLCRKPQRPPLEKYDLYDHTNRLVDGSEILFTGIGRMVYKHDDALFYQGKFVNGYIHNTDAKIYQPKGEVLYRGCIAFGHVVNKDFDGEQY